MEETNNYRKWAAFNDNLTARNYAENLYRVIDERIRLDTLSCELVRDDDPVKYRIQDSSISSVLLLIESERADLLLYLKTHYLPQEAVNRPDEILLGESGQSTLQADSPKSNPSFFNQHLRRYFHNKNIRKHVVGYAIIGIIVLQFFIIPTNVYGVKYPDFSKFLWVIFFSALTYLATRNYKIGFLTGGIRYGTVWSVTFWLYTFIFLVGGIQIAIIDSFRGTTGIGMSSILIIIILGAGYVSGWILSFPIYFLVGGKVVTDPSAIKYRE
jgi:hypothetical protein